MKNLDDQDILEAQQAQLTELTEAARAVHAAVDAVDIAISDELGIHRNDLRCLNLLEKGPMSASEIGKRTGLTSGSVTALIDRLEQAGFVTRKRSTIDRRSIEVEITSVSYARIYRLYNEVGEALRRHFQDKEPEQLKSAVDALRGFSAAHRVAVENLPITKIKSKTV